MLFPSSTAPACISLVVGTNGLAPDEQSLGKPGHARKVSAICSWLNRRTGTVDAWAKRDPVRIDLGMPKQVRSSLEPYRSAADKYEKVIYGLFLPRSERSVESDSVTRSAASAFMDLVAEERGDEPLAAFVEEKNTAQGEWLAGALPATTVEDVAGLLEYRRFVILEGPPGTGKTRLAEQLRKRYPRGKTIQFHPSTTYENFVGGLAPEESTEGMGLRFSPRRGALMEAIADALAHPGDRFLLHIDEINRADLAKVLGEAIYLFEPASPDREVDLPYDFGPPIGRTLKLPPNLYVVGTMNSADRSIAILDIAVRRRFAFLPVWPDPKVLMATGASQRAQEAFKHLFTIFLEEASEETLALMPGHAYFLDGGKGDDLLLRTSLKPLLQEYLLQGYVSGFPDSIRAYLDWLDATPGN